MSDIAATTVKKAPTALQRARRLKPFVFILLLAPALWMVYQAVFNQLGAADPAKHLVDESGTWAIRMILLALAVTPLRLITGQVIWIHFRRMVGLYAFFYASIHFLLYGTLLLGWDFSLLGDELTHRPYIIVGFFALMFYLPLAITSTHGWQHRLKKRWKTLHRLVYAIGILAVIHMTWLKKLGLVSTWPYALTLIILFAIRIADWAKHKSASIAKRR